MFGEQQGQRLFFVFLVAWGLLNAAQAAFTQLDPDEAYYWIYARQLAWGYFDHPPMIAALIRGGYALFANELGVRVGVIALQLGSFYGIWLLLGQPQKRAEVWLLIGLLAAMPMLQVYGFIATPDAPLLFFTVFFFWLYQRFVEKATWTHTLLLGLCMALLLYSKYHGVLLIFFTLLSNWRLLLHPRFYAASVFGALLFVPHLYWQYAQDFPSFRYHLVGRDDPYELKHTLTYLLNQLVVFSPFLFPMIVLALWRRRPADALERAFYYSIFGFWLFFLYTTSKGHVEPQWTVILSIPFVIIVWREAQQRPRYALWVQRLAVATVLLLLVARIALLKNNLFQMKSDFHRSAWTGELQAQAKGLPVVFQNSYRDPSMYAFYTGEQPYTFTDANYRKNQFDIRDWEKELHNRRVLIAGQPNWDCTDCKKTELTRKTVVLRVADSLQIAQKVRLDFVELPVFRQGEAWRFTLTVENPYAHTIRLGVGDMPVRFVGVWYDPQRETVAGFAALQFDKPLHLLKPQAREAVVATILPPQDLPVGAYVFALGVQTGDLPPAFNSRLVSVAVEK